MARVEIFFPDLPEETYSRLQNELEKELTYTFGGCSVVQGVKGLYLSQRGRIEQDRINLLFTDIEFRFSEDFAELEEYVEYLHRAIISTLSEEKVLIVVHSVFHQT